MGTLTRSIVRVVTEEGREWYIAIEQVLFGYRRRLISCKASPFGLLHGIKPEGMAANTIPKGIESSSYRDVELQAVWALRAKRVNEQTKRSAKKGPTI